MDYLKNEYKKIYASLEFGRLVFGPKLLLLYIALAVCLLIPLATIGIIITYFCGDMDLTKNIIILLIFINLIMILCIVLNAITINRKKKINRFIIEVLKDGIKISARAEQLDVNNKNYKPYRILVTFEYNGQIKQKLSNSGNIALGYNKYFLTYCGHPFNILYSPKYDHVLILKWVS